MTEDERIVRGAWKEVRYVDTGPSLWVRTHYVIIGHPQLFAAYRNTRGEAWLAARDFTEQRQHEIAEVEEEIQRLAIWYARRETDNVDLRTMARLQKALVDLWRGMKERK